MAPSLLLALGTGFALLTAIALVAANPDLVQGGEARPDPEDPCEPLPTPAPSGPSGEPGDPCREPPAAVLA